MTYSGRSSRIHHPHDESLGAITSTTHAYQGLIAGDPTPPADPWSLHRHTCLYPRPLQIPEASKHVIPQRYTPPSVTAYCGRYRSTRIALYDIACETIRMLCVRGHTLDVNDPIDRIKSQWAVHAQSPACVSHAHSCGHGDPIIDDRPSLS